jgi:hypothetical protein
MLGATIYQSYVATKLVVTTDHAWLLYTYEGWLWVQHYYVN